MLGTLVMFDINLLEDCEILVKIIEAKPKGLLPKFSHCGFKPDTGGRFQ